MMKKRPDLNLSGLVSALVVVVLLVIFSVATEGSVLSKYCLKSILEQAMLLIMGGLGMIFVIAQGSMDMSQGSVLAASSTVALFAAVKFGAMWYLPTAILIGLFVGFLNGFIVSKLKVSSFMTTIAFLIALRAFVELVLSKTVLAAPAGVRVLNQMYIKLPALLVLVIVFGFIFELTSVGRYSKAIGENENVVACSGVRVNRLKITAFMFSGLMGALVGCFMTSRQAGSNVLTGNMFEMRVMMAMFLGGIPVSGGMSTKLYKLIIGSFSISILENGLTLVGVNTYTTELIEGFILVGVVALIPYINNLKFRGRDALPTELTKKENA